MAASQGFWSYVHADDEAEVQRISRLARDVAAQFEMLTGEPLALFLDRDAIEWGEAWRDKVDSSLASVAFFIPVITPRYFMSPECRRELQTMSGHLGTSLPHTSMRSMKGSAPSSSRPPKQSNRTQIPRLEYAASSIRSVPFLPPCMGH